MTYPSHWMRAYADAGEWQYERVEKKYWETKEPHRQRELLPDGSVVPEGMHTGEAMAAYVDRCLGSDAPRVVRAIMAGAHRPRASALRDALGVEMAQRLIDCGLVVPSSHCRVHVAVEYWAARHCEEVGL